jgi:hypothetical protein
MPIVLSEHKEQVSFIHKAKKYLRDKGREELIPLLFAIPNGGARDRIAASAMKMEGVRAGVPDLFFAHPSGRYHGLFIEMKKRVGGSLSPDQKEMLKALEGQDYACHVALGYDEAVSGFVRYIEEGHL